MLKRRREIIQSWIYFCAKSIIYHEVYYVWDV